LAAKEENLTLSIVQRGVERQSPFPH